tara:strand:- start:251 stop:499 length:249 start_codon:yes stop_codon:yes gene_type:complete
MKAFPGVTVERSGMHSTNRVNNPGMDLRDYFAGQFIQTLEVSSGRIILHGNGESTYDLEKVAAGLYRLADAMIKQRGSKEGK